MGTQFHQRDQQVEHRRRHPAEPGQFQGGAINPVNFHRPTEIKVLQNARPMGHLAAEAERAIDVDDRGAAKRPGDRQPFRMDRPDCDLARRIGSWREDRTPLPERVQDIISSFYFLRAQPLAIGQDVRVDMFSRGKVYKLKAQVLEKERVETEAGVFDAFKLQPQLRENETDEDRNRGKLFLWFSDDERRLPVMARTVMPIGSVTARLRKITAGTKPSSPAAPAGTPESAARKGDPPAAP